LRTIVIRRSRRHWTCERFGDDPVITIRPADGVDV
jgi:hypothetical protein